MVPYVDVCMLSKTRYSLKRLQIEYAIMPGQSSSHLERLAAIGQDMVIDAPGFAGLENIAGYFLFLNEQSNRCCEHIVPGAMIVFGGSFFSTQWRGKEPVKVTTKPAFHALLILRGPLMKALNEADGIHNS